jgi:hypothetical protein
MPKIIQIIRYEGSNQMPERILGLGDDGVVYKIVPSKKKPWEVFVPALEEKHE